MQKVKNFKRGVWFILMLGWAPVFAQPTLGEIIEVTKRKKLNELLMPTPTPLSASQGGKALPLPTLEAVVAPSANKKEGKEQLALWSLSGVNTNLIAEIWDGQKVYRFNARQGYTIENGWSVVSASAQSITLKHGKRILTLYPVELGSTGAEFEKLKIQNSIDAGLLKALKSSGVANLPAPLSMAQSAEGSGKTGMQPLSGIIQADEAKNPSLINNVVSNIPKINN
jgi:hypothetical protein